MREVFTCGDHPELVVERVPERFAAGVEACAQTPLDIPRRRFRDPHCAPLDPVPALLAQAHAPLVVDVDQHGVEHLDGRSDHGLRRGAVVPLATDVGGPRCEGVVEREVPAALGRAGPAHDVARHTMQTEPARGRFRALTSAGMEDVRRTCAPRAGAPCFASSRSAVRARPPRSCDRRGGLLEVLPRQRRTPGPSASDSASRTRSASLDSPCRA